MFIITREKIVFLKTFKTAGTKIEAEASKHLRSDDIQIEFGSGHLYTKGHNQAQVKFEKRSILTLRFWILLPWALKWKISKHNWLNEHIDLDQLLWLMPSLIDHKFVIVYRDEQKVNESNKRMYARRGYGVHPKPISNSLFFRSRFSFLPLPQIIIVSYDKIKEIENVSPFFAKVKFNWEAKIN
jgi:hypothetical protein